MTGAIQTRATPVGGGAADKQPIFSVNPGIELEDALGELSHLLDCAQATTFELCDSAVPDRRLVGAALHCIQGAQAVVAALSTKAKPR
jgi:hypothetical protein